MLIPYFSRMRARQLSFFPPPPVEYGGDASVGKRKVVRPFHPKKALHVTLHSSQARGATSLLRSGRPMQIFALLRRVADKRGVKVYRYANVGNHLHLLIGARSHWAFKAFLREFAGGVAVIVTGAIKGRAAKFWDTPPWSKIIEWGRHFAAAANYVLLNVLESTGRRDCGLLERLKRDGIILLDPAPG